MEQIKCFIFNSELGWERTYVGWPFKINEDFDRNLLIALKDKQEADYYSQAP